MGDTKRQIHATRALSRRGFLAVGSAAAAATALPLGAATEKKVKEEAAAKAEAAEQQAIEKKPAIVKWRTLGRTGFKASDVSMGAAATDSNLVRYAYDLGINYFDTAESYGNGEHERAHRRGACSTWTARRSSSPPSWRSRTRTPSRPSSSASASARSG